ncbi:MAG: 2-hydroxyacyl-CoA dehydratase family protein, partial [Promethearchaeia archaeon]
MSLMKKIITPYLNLFVLFADCFIFTSHIGCKQFGSVPQVLREALREEVGIPMLTIDLDVGDKRFTSMKIIRDKLNMFAKTL